MSWWKKERFGQEAEMLKLRHDIKQVKKHRSKVLASLKLLERWFAQGKIDYPNYKEREKELLKLSGEYNLYLHVAERKLQKIQKSK